jgi:electron transfer flavoprotein beta subunit
MAEVGPLTIAVLVKQVPDMNAVRIERTTGKIQLSPQLKISSYDEYAIEAALRLKERFGGEAIVVTAGPASARDAVTRALAMGADRGIHVELPEVNATDTLGIAQLLAGAVRPVRRRTTWRRGRSARRLRRSSGCP